MSNHNCPLNTSSHNRPRRRASLMDELNLPISNSNSSSTPHKTNNYSDDHPFGRSDDHLVCGSRRPSRLHDHHDTTTPNSGRRPTLLQSVSMRGSFTFRRNTLGEELEGRRRSSTRVGGGIRGGSFRRLSLQIEHGGQGGDRREMQDASVSDYQEVFQQMKLQNPTASLGALQQKTMKRMSEIKLEKEEMERMNLERLRELEKGSRQHQQQQQQHCLNGRMTLLGSLFSHHHQSKGGSDCSDHKNMNSGSDRDGSDRSNNHHHQNSFTNTTTTTPLKAKAPYAVDDSFRSNNSIEITNETLLSRPTVLSRATTVFSRRSSCADSSTNTAAGGGNGENNPMLNRRRSTMDTNPLSDGDASTDNIHGTTTTTTNNGAATTVAVLRSSLILMGEDQKGNFAPRKSVGDLTRMCGSDDEEEEVDDSIFGAQSKMSGLFISGDEEEDEDEEEEEEEEEGKESNVEENDDDDGRGMGSTIFNNNDEEIEILVSQLQQLDDTSQRSHPNCDVSHTTETYHSAMSDSNHTTFTEGSYFDNDNGSLIVGFEKQRVEKEDVSRGFAADFSAWDKR